MLLGLVLSLFVSERLLAQSEPSTGKMSVHDRLVKARDAKAQKKIDKATGADAALPPSATTQINKRLAQPASPQAKTASNSLKATPADYKSSIDKTQRGPHGEVIYTGARGAKYYINKNGNKTYLSSNL